MFTRKWREEIILFGCATAGDGKCFFRSFNMECAYRVIIALFKQYSEGVSFVNLLKRFFARLVKGHQGPNV